MSNLSALASASSLEQYIHGNPAEVITATRTPRILVIGLHGDEDLAARVAYYIQMERPDLHDYVDYICGNPRAAANQIRATTPLTDLNRSFRPEGEPAGYEEKRAQELLAMTKKYDYVLDVHTSETECGRFFLVADSENESVRTIIASSNIDRIVVLPRQLTDPALLGNVPRSIAIEYNEILACEPASTLEIVAIVDGLINKEAHKRDREFYFVERVVPKNQDPGDVRNFELCREGYFPVLFGVGKKSYRNDPSKDYLGFAATKMNKIKL